MLKNFSLTSRLTIFFTIVSAVVLLGLGGLFLFASGKHFVELDRSTLQDKKRLIEDILDDARSTDDAKARLREALSHHHGLYVLVKDAQGNVLFVTEGFHPPQDSTFTPEGLLLHWANGKHEFRGLSFHSKPTFPSASNMLTFVAIDTEHHSQFMQDLQRTLLLYMAVAVIVSGFLSWFAAYKGMAPLRAMKARAAAVSGQQLNQRMPVDAVPIEMADLAMALNQMLDRLQADFLRLSEFSADLAHELRTPLSNLLTQTQVALASRRDAETYREILASNAEEFERLARMVSDMLFLAKTRRGVELPNKEQFSAAHEISALIDFYEAVADEKGIRVKLQGDGDIVGDRLMFRRAVSNLLSNALRHASPRGDVAISVQESAGVNIVSVENTGDDIAPGVLPRLFDRFFRADPARAHPASDGAGLGLSITRAIVEAHGGTASACSSNGRTRFTLTFPRGGVAQREVN